MERNLAHVTLLVNDYDKAIDFYVGKLKFILVEDTMVSETKRWVRISPSVREQCTILLAKANSNEQLNVVGKQTADKVAFFLYTDNVDKEYQNAIDNNISIIKQPQDLPHGKVMVIADLYGNLWDVIEPNVR